MRQLRCSDTEKEQRAKPTYGRLAPALKKPLRKQTSNKGMVAIQGGKVLTGRGYVPGAEFSNSPSEGQPISN